MNQGVRKHSLTSLPMPHTRQVTFPLMVIFVSFCTWLLPSYNTPFLPPPVNDNCTNATRIDITGGGYDYGVYSSAVSDMTMATAQSGEFFQFAPNHTKSVWFTFTLLTRRSARIEVLATAGSVFPSPTDAGVTVYRSASCLPGSANNLGAFISSGNLSNPCLEAGNYLIQVTGVTDITASIMVNLTLGCPDHPIDSKFDCSSKAYEFNGGMPLAGTAASEEHHIECHSITDPSENNCLPVANKQDYQKSSWYVFTTGSSVDFLDFYFPATTDDDVIGYRLFEGNVKVNDPTSLMQLDCGIAKARFVTRYVEFFCMLKPNTTYSLALLFHKDYAFNDMIVTVRQRGENATGWPKPTLNPVVASNQLGSLPGSDAPGILTTWTDRFDCSSFIIDNVCAPANPASGQVVIGTGANTKTFNMTTWATFTLTADANVEFRYSSYNVGATFYTRIFNKTLTNTCPSPDPSTDLAFAFQGSYRLEKCMPPGEYSIQLLTSSGSAFPPGAFYNNAWSSGSLGTAFTLDVTVVYLPSNGMFGLHTPGDFNAINGLNPLQNDVTYTSTASIFTCKNTALPNATVCPFSSKAIYREVNIGDATGDGVADEGLLCMGILRTDSITHPPIVYGFYKGDANQLATSAGTHSEGQKIPGLTDYAGFCIDDIDNFLNPPDIENFCVCVTPGTYTLAGFGDVDNVGKGDQPSFKFNVHKTIHDSPANAELITLGPSPGSYVSQPDFFSCTDNLGSMPPCGNARKLVFREFFLPEDAVVSITEVGNGLSVLSLFNGRAVDASWATLHTDCFRSVIITDLCTPLVAGWYTLVSYGQGPSYSNTALPTIGSPGVVGERTIVTITLDVPITPNFNRPHKAHFAGITDFETPTAVNPNAITRRIYPFPTDTFCLPDTPFIADSLLPCAPGYNRVAFYVFEITKTSFVQIRNINQSIYSEIYPFDVRANPEMLLTVPPVYECLSTQRDFRQICDLPPGRYTIAFQASDLHKGTVIYPVLYVDASEPSRFDHAWKAYDFDLIPKSNTYVNGKLLDVHPTFPGQAPSRDVFYCTTGATTIDPTETQCGTQFNDLIYAQPSGVPKPLFYQNNPLNARQPWRNLWYTFMLSGSGICTLKAEALSGVSDLPLIAVYESPADASIPWSDFQTMLANPGNTIIPGLKLITENVDLICDADSDELIFTKSGCIRDSVRYYVVASFDAEFIYPPNIPNQTISLSVKYDPRPTFAAPYDERTSANVINGLVETTAPYTSVPLVSGNTFTSTDFSLLCYTRNTSDPSGCNPPLTRKSAWFKFEVGTAGHFYAALEKIGVPNGWFANEKDMTVWKEDTPGGPLTNPLPLNVTATTGHEWLNGCIDPGTYYLLIRHCDLIDTIQPYRVVMELSDSPGDFCSNAIPIDIIGMTSDTGIVMVDCHSIGTDIGEYLPVGNTCFAIPKRKTSWYHATVNAGPMVDLNFRFEENFEGTAVNLNDLSYRILAGTCGAMTPIVCSAIGTNNITLNCLAPGDYYIQVAMPQRTGTSTSSPILEGPLSLIITPTPSDTATCTEPLDPNQVTADFSFSIACDSIQFINLSTAGTDISYLWEFPDGTSTEVDPLWIPPVGSGTYSITLTVTNNASGLSATNVVPVTFSTPFINYTPMPDATICNDAGNVLLDATVTGATYTWDNGSTDPTHTVTSSGTYSVIISKDGCEKYDTVVVGSIDAIRNIEHTLCPESNITIEGEVFDLSHPSGMIILPNAHPSGCDSILNVNILFHAPAEFEFTETICEGDDYIFGSQTLSAAGIYQNTYVSSKGCDSIVTLTLAVTQKQSIIADIVACIGIPITLIPNEQGASYQWSDGTTGDSIQVDADGGYTVLVRDDNNCVISEELFGVMFETLASPVVPVPAIACPGSDVIVAAQGSSGNYLWFDAPAGGNMLGTGSNLIIQDIQQDMIVYAEAILTSGSDSCISERTPVTVMVTSETAKVEIVDTFICVGNSLVLPWNEEVFPDSSDSYFHNYTSVVNGCDSLYLTVNINVIDLPPLTMPSILTLHLGDSILLIPQIDFIPDSISWFPSEGLSCTDCPQTWAKPVKTTTYEVEMWSPEGCTVASLVQIEVNNDVRIFIPNVFSPNGDGENELFTVYAKHEVAIVRKLTIFDRWGEAVWQKENFLPDGTYGWDGIGWGKPMPSGVYVWLCEIDLIDGTTQVLAGDLTLIR